MNNETRDIFDVISTYFVNCYWNDLFDHARDALNQRHFNTMEESYCEMVERYRKAFTELDPHEKINPHYDRIMGDMHKSYKFYFQSNSSYSDFIDVLSRQFIPRDLYAVLSRQDRRKDEVVRRVFTKVVNEFSMFTATDGLQNVLRGRERDAQRQMMAWKKKGIEFLQKERSALYARAMAEKTGVDPNKKEGISREAFEKMQDKIKNLIYEKAELRKTVNSYAQYIKLLKKRVAELENARTEVVAVPRHTRQLPQVQVVDEALEDIEEESSQEEEDDEESQTLPRINNPDDRDDPHGINDVAAPLDDLSEYSGEDFVNAVELGNSSLEDDALSADE